MVRTVQRRARASRDIAEDAFSFAWAQFIRVQPDRERNWRGWLVGKDEHATLEDVVTDDRHPTAARAEWREALDALSKVPERRRRAKALAVMGFKYDEIAAMPGLSYTRVNQLLAEANRVLREEQGRAAVAAETSRPPRAVRQDERERRTPRWLSAALGPRPGKTTNSHAFLAWRPAALAV